MKLIFARDFIITTKKVHRLLFDYLRTFAPKSSHVQILLKLWLQVENDKIRLKT